MGQKAKRCKKAKSFYKHRQKKTKNKLKRGDKKQLKTKDALNNKSRHERQRTKAKQITIRKQTQKNPEI